jgi:hypothetical protein
LLLPVRGLAPFGTQKPTTRTSMRRAWLFCCNRRVRTPMCQALVQEPHLWTVAWNLCNNGSCHAKGSVKRVAIATTRFPGRFRRVVCHPCLREYADPVLVLTTTANSLRIHFNRWWTTWVGTEPRPCGKCAGKFMNTANSTRTKPSSFLNRGDCSKEGRMTAMFFALSMAVGTRAFVREAPPCRVKRSNCS